MLNDWVEYFFSGKGFPMADEKLDEEVVDEPEESKSHVKEEGIELEGIVREALRGNFRVEVAATKEGAKPLMVLAHLAGKLRKNFIKIVPGDRVKVEVSPYDFARGRITFRMK